MIISNISHLTGKGIGIRIAGELLRPGRTRTVPDTAVTDRHRRMFGKYLHPGTMPSLVPVASPVGPMTEAEAAEHLQSLSLAQLHSLADAVLPPLTKRANSPRMVHALLRAIRCADLDPEFFFFLRRWTRSRDTYIPVE